MSETFRGAGCDPSLRSDLDPLRSEGPMRVLADIDWNRWSPNDRATLIFVIEGDRILLIEKKRGLGAGKVNGPGGRLEPNETPIDAACREIEEELGVRAVGVVEHGE